MAQCCDRKDESGKRKIGVTVDMERWKNWFYRQKMNVKFTLVIGIIAFIPLGIIFLLFYYNEQQNTIQQQLYTTRSDMQQTYSDVQKTVELCNMTTQSFLNSRNLEQMLIRLKAGDAISTSEYVEFHSEDIMALERLVNSNPYLYQTRVYADSGNFPEMMPILYRKNRMMQLPWAQEYESGTWQFDYKDVIFSESVMNSAQHMMSLITSMNDYEHGEIGTIEVAVRMENIFPEVFAVSEDSYSCYVDAEGMVHNNGANARNCEWVDYQSAMLYLIKDQIRGNTSDCFMTKLGGQRVVIGYMPLPELGGYLVTLESLEPQLQILYGQRNMLLFGTLILFLIVVFMTDRLVKIILRQFYKTLGVIRQVQGGDLQVRIQDCGEDEMGELGTQFNVMLDCISNLMEENISREVLAKNSEIRALQNQINAHFIYNVLESVKMMAEIKEEYEISDAVTALGKLLRYTMKWTSPFVTVEQEIEYIRNYLQLINLRFDYVIQLSLNIPQLAYAQQIPKMSLQPVIENAIIHGIEDLAEDATIYVKAIIEDGRMSIEITDSGKGMTPEQVEMLEKKIIGKTEVSGGSGNGIGLKNVQDRIRMAYGSEYGIRVNSKPDCYTKIIITIPQSIGGKHNEKFTDCRR
ncbi:MAG: sensor histidine kinase [Hespellia sp.]|nr:sensor histidine kinase [Hespellia sp.]